MDKITKIIKFYFVNSFKGQLITAAAVLLLHLFISIAVVRLVKTQGATGGSNDVIMLVWMFVLGLVLFTPGFKYVLSQGISRKKFFLALSVSLTLLAAAFAVLSTVFYALAQKFGNIWMLYHVMYRNEAIVGVLTWEFATFLFFGILGWLICLVYYVSGRKTKWMVTLTPFVLISLLTFFNILTDGRIVRSIWDFFVAIQGLSVAHPNSYIGMASMLAGAVILSGPIFLLMRRVQIKDA